MNSHLFIKSLLIYGLALPLAIYLGFRLANPQSFLTLALVGGLLFFLMIPMLLRWHHFLVVVMWNFAAVAFFLPGRPQAWLVATAMSLGIIVVRRTMDKRFRLISVPAISRPLLFLGLVVMVTTFFTGGMGFNTFGAASYGGKRIVVIFGAIAGYFAFVSQPIPLEKAKLYVGLHFLAFVSCFVGVTANWAPGGMGFLYQIFPVEAMGQAALMGDVKQPIFSLFRSSNLSLVASGILCFLLMMYGLRGVLDMKHPWRAIVMLGVLFLSAIGGFRSAVLLLVGLLLVQFLLEKLHRTHHLIMVVLASGLLLAASLPFVNQMPLSVQRALSVLPVEVDPMAKESADTTIEWRVEMWNWLVPEIPKYFWLGKGYSIKAAEYEVIVELQRNLRMDNRMMMMMSGDYHNGPLSVIIPLGIWGVIAVLWFWGASFGLLIRNFKFSHPELKTTNTLLLSLMIVKVAMFLVVFGTLYLDMMVFAGIVGLSVSVNGGVCRPAWAARPSSLTSWRDRPPAMLIPEPVANDSKLLPPRPIV